MSKNLVIVESPAKARTISQFLGSDFNVVSSFGHIRDLPKKGIGVDVAKNFEPTYEVSPDKTKVVSGLKRDAKGHDVWLATDEDREGEAIAWHITEILKIDPAKTKRIVFHEITKPAIERAIEKPRTLDMKLVDAQQARRVLDRLVGYELSPVLWKKVRTGLSAGRVQSVAVRLIVEREREIRAFNAEVSYKVTANFDVGKDELPAELNNKLASKDKAHKFLTDITNADFKVASVEQKPGKKIPGPPFTTSTLQQEASRKLGYSVRQTMTLAQRLYENGHITYMRTDSTNLSPIAVDAINKYVSSTYGNKYSKAQQYKTKDASAQEAHEAIRPTAVAKLEAGNDSQQTKLYKLIWQRAVASQMTAAEVLKTEVVIDISNRDEKFIATGEVISFDGYLKVYGGGKEDKILPGVETGQKLELKRVDAVENYTRPAARYSEAALVKKLEALGIGRPSTYAPTISTVQDRGYVEKTDLAGEERIINSLSLDKGSISEHSETVITGADKNKLVPTHVAEVVTDFLLKHFTDIVDYDFTARAEENFDNIADGKIGWQKMLAEFYKDFHPLVEKSADIDRADAAQARELGKHPKSGKPVVVRYGRYGPVLQLGDAENKEEKVQFAPLPDGTTIEDITLEKALPMFNLPRIVGKTKSGEEISANIGRFGPYVKVDKTFVSIKGQDPLQITEEEAVKLLEEKAEETKNRVIADWGKLKILRGPYGSYITDGKKNARIPKDTEPEKLDEKQATEILAKAPEKKRFVRRKKKS